MGLAGGDGGFAFSDVHANSAGAAPLQLSARATGGAGGAASAEGTRGGTGGGAMAAHTLDGGGSGVLDLTVLDTATGGRGGDGNLDVTPYTHGGDGGGAYVSHGAVYAGRSLNVTQTAVGGAGGTTMYGVGGRGGEAGSTVGLMTDASMINVNGTAIGGQGGGSAGNPLDITHPAGTPGGGGNASSQQWVSSSTRSLNARITSTSTAVAGQPGDGVYAYEGGYARARSGANGGGLVTSVADATGGYGALAGGPAEAYTGATSNYVAITRASATGGGAYLNPGARAIAEAGAYAGYYARADAVANSGSGRFGAMEEASASAEAFVARPAGAALPTIPGQQSEARAHAAASSWGGTVAALSTYTDDGRHAAVTTRASNVKPMSLYIPGADTAANVGGAAYGPWAPPDGATSEVFSHASALPTAASVAPLIASSAEVATAFGHAGTLAAGTMAAAFFPMTASAELRLPFSAGSHLLLGLVRPFFSPGLDSGFSLSVERGGVSLYSGSFTTLAQANAVFNGHVLDLGVINANTLDLLLTFTLESGIYGFSYLVGQGGAAAPVPEPDGWMLLMLGLALLAWRAGAFNAARIGPMRRMVVPFRISGG